MMVELKNQFHSQLKERKEIKKTEKKCCSYNLVGYLLTVLIIVVLIIIILLLSLLLLLTTNKN